MAAGLSKSVSAGGAVATGGTGSVIGLESSVLYDVSNGRTIIGVVSQVKFVCFRPASERFVDLDGFIGCVVSLRLEFYVTKVLVVCK